MATVITTPANPESVVWNEEETRFLRAVMSSEFLRTGENKQKTQASPPRTNVRENEKPPVGEFRVLVIGAKGVGKTSILTRFCKGRLPAEGEPHDPYYDQGCRHVVEIDSQNYTVDALEMPSKHLWRDDLVAQAINITEGAILVYDVTDPDSLRMARGLHDLIQTTISSSSASNPSALQQQQQSGIPQSGREYALLLVGNKSDVPDSDRVIAYSEGSKVATTFQVKTSFMEVSAKAGDQISLLFLMVGKEVLKLRTIAQQKKEYAVQTAKLREEAARKPVGRVGFWRRISRPFRREIAQV